MPELRSPDASSLPRDGTLRSGNVGVLEGWNIGGRKMGRMVQIDVTLHYSILPSFHHSGSDREVLCRSALSVLFPSLTVLKPHGLDYGIRPG